MKLKTRSIIAGMAAMMCLAGCSGQKSLELGPSETVEAFCRAVSGGQWSNAETLCDTLGMKEYIDGYKAAWGKLEKEDAGAMKVAKSILEGTTVTIGDMQKDGDKRIVAFTLEADGMSKTKKAIVKREEGAWKVESITEAN